MSFDFGVSLIDILMLILSILILFIMPFISFFLIKRNLLKKQNEELEEIKKEKHVQKKKNENLTKELNQNIKETELLVSEIKECNENIQLIDDYEFYKKKKHRETYFIQSYVGLDKEKMEETTDILSAQIFTKIDSVELSEDEKIKLINDSPETENKEANLFDKALYEEALNIKKQLDSNKKNPDNLNNYKPIKKGEI